MLRIRRETHLRFGVLELQCMIDDGVVGLVALVRLLLQKYLQKKKKKSTFLFLTTDASNVPMIVNSPRAIFGISLGLTIVQKKNRNLY